MNKIEDTLEVHAALLAPDHMDRVYRYLRLALEERLNGPHPIRPKPISVPKLAFGNVLESQTLEELEARRNDHYALLMECLGILERTFGMKSVYGYPNFDAICRYLANNGHLTTLCYFVNQDIYSVPFTCSWLDEIAKRYQAMVDERKKPRFNEVELSLDSSIQLLAYCPLNKDNRSINSYRLVAFAILEFIAICLHTATTTEERKRLVKYTKRFLSVFPKSVMGHGAIHMLCYYIYEEGRLPPSTSALLVEHLSDCGADMNDRDSNGDTPLHIIAKSRHIDERKLATFKALLSKGAHPDYRDYLNSTPLASSSHKVVQDLLRKNPPSLQCLAAHSIIDQNIPRAPELLTSEAEEIIKHHQKWKP